jgi:RimJ/RimL family protein N-acetyltransferase
MEAGRVRFVCRDFGLSDLPRRGLAPHEAPLEVLLLDIEAELSIWEDGRVVWSEEAFPVAELAYHLALWIQRPGAGREDFELDSMQAEPGLVRIMHSDEGWRIGSILAPEFWTSPVAWDVLVAAIKQFDRSVREGIRALGMDPAFLPQS